MNTLAFLSGIGVTELIILLLFFALPIAVIVLIIRLTRRRPINVTVNQNFGDTPILKNAEKLKALKTLQEKGIISEKEFEEEKKKILGL